MKNSKEKKTYILLTCVIIFSFVIMGFNYFFSQDGKMVIITRDGEIIEELPLSENTEVTVKGLLEGENVIKIEDGFCFVSGADCPDKLCINQGKISKEGESIICLPHRIVIKIVGSGAQEIDTIAR